MRSLAVKIGAVLLLSLFLVACSVDQSELNKLIIDNEEKIGRINELTLEISKLEKQLQELKNSVESKFREANSLYESGQYNEAKSLLSDIILNEPTSPVVPHAEALLSTINEILSDNFQAVVAEAESAKNAKESIKLLDDYIQSNPNSDYLDEVHALIQQYEEIQYESPLTINKVWVTTGPNGKLEARVRVKNETSKTIDAYKLILFTFNNFNEPVKSKTTDSNVLSAMEQTTLSAGKTSGDSAWDLSAYASTTKIKAIVGSVHFTDDTVWENPRLSDQIKEEQVRYP